VKVTKIGLVVFLGSFLSDQRVEAQFQRMFLPVGHFSLAPNGVEKYRSYCLDPDKDIPNERTRFRHSAGEIMVRVRGDEKWLDLRKAQELRWVDLRGKGLVNDIDIVNLSDKDLEFDLKGGVIIPVGDFAKYQPIPPLKDLIKLLGTTPRDPDDVQDQGWESIENFRKDSAFDDMKNTIARLVSGSEVLEVHQRNNPDTHIIAVSKERRQVLAKGPRRGIFKVLKENGKVFEVINLFELPKKKENDSRYFWFQAYDSATRERITMRSTKLNRFVYCGTIGDGIVRLQIGREVESIACRDVLTFLDTGAAPDRFRDLFEPGVNYVFTRNILEHEGARQEGPVIDYFATSELLACFQRSAPKSRFYLNDELEIALENLARKLPKVKGNLQVIEPDSFDVVSRNILKAVRSDLTNNQIEVVQPEKITAANVIVLTGARGAEFDSMMREFFNSGIFRNRIVIVFSCSEGGGEDLMHSFLSSAGRPLDRPQGILFYRDHLSSLAVQEVLLQMSRLAGTAGSVRDLIENAVEKLQKRQDLLIPEREIRKLREIIHQISRIDRPLQAGGFSV
jgi:hypothetical protein